jgi:hypothetical protein
LRVSAGRLAIVVVLVATIAPVIAPVIATGAGEPASKNYQTRFAALKPPVSGLSVTTEGGDKYLVVKNGTGKTVEVPGYDGEPYLRFLPNGKVEANASSPAKYLNGIRFGTPDSVQIPRSALLGGKPKWQQVATGGTYRWFDHRIHWMDKKPPPIVKDESKRTKIFDWKVPARVGGTPVTMLGTLTWVPAADASSGLSTGAIALIAVAVLALLALIALLIRRRRGPAPAGTARREKAAKEAW